VIAMPVIVVGARSIAWRRRHYRQTYALRFSSPGRTHENVAHKAFAHGNMCMMEGKFDEARAALREVGSAIDHMEDPVRHDISSAYFDHTRDTYK
jgi:hypothetical protein